MDIPPGTERQHARCSVRIANQELSTKATAPVLIVSSVVVISPLTRLLD